MNDPLYGNKVAAALLIVALLAIGLPVVVGTFSELAEHASHHGDDHAAIEGCPEGLVFAPFDCGGLGAAAEASDEPEVPFVNVFLEADAERGARAAAICSSCHSFDKGGPNGTGPNLWDVMGREVASVPGYAYSSALQALGGTWTLEAMDPYLENSQGYVSGTQMAQKIRKDEKRADIIMYLRSLSDSPFPLPEPVEVAQEAEGEDGEASDGEGSGDTAMEEVGEAAADAMDFEAAGPGEAVRTDQSEVNNPGDDGFPGDPAKDGSNYSSSNEDGADVDGGDVDAGFRDEGGLPNEAAAEASEQRSAPDEPDGETGGGGDGTAPEAGGDADAPATQNEGGE